MGSCFRATLTTRIAYQNKDDFVRNLVCLRGELLSGLAVPVPAGVLKDTLPLYQRNAGDEAANCCAYAPAAQLQRETAHARK